MQFIIAGWHYNQENYIKELIDLENNNDIISVFWSCHRDPPQIIKDNFKWKLFPNLGMSDGSYQQAIDYLDLDDETICFFTHDDIIIKNWHFIEACNVFLQKYKVLGNCMNSVAYFDPNDTVEVSGKKFRECAKEETRSLFTDKLLIRTVRSSFICMKYKDVVRVKGFEPIFHFPELVEPKMKKDGTVYIEGYDGIGSIGNLILCLFSYKLNVIFGGESIVYLGAEYLNSIYIYECARGAIDPKCPITQEQK